MLYFSLQDKAPTSSSSSSKVKSNEADKKPPEPKVSPGSKRPSTLSIEGQPKRGGKRQKRNVADGGDKEKEAVGGQRPKNTKRRSIASKVSYKEVSSDGEDELSDGEEYKPTREDESDDSDCDAKRSNRYSNAKGKGKSQAPLRSSKPQKRTKKEEEEETDEEEEQLKRKKQYGRRRQVKGDDEWIEVYLKGAKRWICVDVDQGVGQPERCSSKATQPITYVVGVDEDGYLKDVSSRYDPTWLTSSRRRRINSDWWEETLSFYACPDNKQKQEEDKEVQEDNKNVHIFMH